MIADRTAYDYLTDLGYKFTNGWYARSDEAGRVIRTHLNSIHSSVTDQSSKSQWWI